MIFFSPFMFCFKCCEKKKTKAAHSPQRNTFVLHILPSHRCMWHGGWHKTRMAAVQAPFELKKKNSRMHRVYGGGCAWNLFSHNAPHARMQIYGALASLHVKMMKQRRVYLAKQGKWYAPKVGMVKTKRVGQKKAKLKWRLGWTRYCFAIFMRQVKSEMTMVLMAFAFVYGFFFLLSLNPAWECGVNDIEALTKICDLTLEPVLGTLTQWNKFHDSVLESCRLGVAFNCIQLTILTSSEVWRKDNADFCLTRTERILCNVH